MLKAAGGCCTRCGDRGPLQAHHVKSWAEYPADRLDVANGRALCPACHGLQHPAAANALLAVSGGGLAVRYDFPPAHALADAADTTEAEMAALLPEVTRQLRSLLGRVPPGSLVAPQVALIARPNPK